MPEELRDNTAWGGFLMLLHDRRVPGFLRREHAAQTYFEVAYQSSDDRFSDLDEDVWSCADYSDS